MNEDLKDLYHKTLIERQKSPLGYEDYQQAQEIIEAYNPICGDQFKVYFDIEDDKISKITFHGYGCAISKASTSLLVESLAGKSLSACREQLDYFYKCMGEEVPDAEEIYKALALSKEFPGRHQCATLSWNAIGKFLGQPPA